MSENPTHEKFFDGAAIGRQTLYLLLSFPLGIASFVFTVVLLSLGIGTLIIGIGIPILLALFLGVRAFLSLERRLSRRLLGLDLPAPRSLEAPTPVLQRLLFHAGRLESWSAVLYLVLKLPLGILSFVVALVSVVLPIVFAAAAFATLFLTALPVELGWGSTIYLDPLSGAALLGLIAVLLGGLGVLLVAGLAQVWRAINGVMLGADIRPVIHPSEPEGAILIP